MIAEILVDLNIDDVNQKFAYLVADEIKDKIKVGMRVSVTFASRKIMGIVLSLKKYEEWLSLNEKHKNIDLITVSELLDVIPSFTEEMLALGEEVAFQNISNLIAAYNLMLPKSLRNKYKHTIKYTEDAPSEFKYLFSENKTINYKKTNKKLLEKGLKEKYLKIQMESSSGTGIRYEEYIKINEESIPHDDIKGVKQQLLLEKLLEKRDWVAQRSFLNENAVSNATLKSMIKKNYVLHKKVEVYREALVFTEKSNKKVELTDEQEEAYAKLYNTLGTNKTSLLHGITGSGKTHIYISLIEKVFESGGQAIVLIPEIALTKQLLSRFAKHFGSEYIAVMHSKLSDGERFDEWRRISSGEAKLIIGTRSSIFAPFKDLKLIIIDEEHDNSYKQENTPKYSTIEVAKIRANNFNCPVILGSATPKMETYARAKKGIYNLIELKNRFSKYGLPDVEVVDMSENYGTSDSLYISNNLKDEIKNRLDNKEQTILFLNKRGYAQYVSCKACGHTFKCPHCDVPYSYHRNDKSVKCHYCGRSERPSNLCPECKQQSLSTFGMGIQKIEEEIKEIFPNANIQRMDRDTVSQKNNQEQIIEAFENGKIDILIGTQMIAKGFDFPNVTLVGILSIDNVLNIPTYQGAENAFSLVCQVAGRAGRGEKKGKVIIQSYNPEHYSIQLAKSHNYQDFYKHEMTFRKELNYPPYSYLCEIEFRGNEINELTKIAQNAAVYLKENLSDNVQILGPVAPFVKRIKNLFVLNINVKYKKEDNILAILNDFKALFNSSKVSIIIDPNYIA